MLHINNVGIMSKAMRIKTVESKQLRLKYNKIALRCTYHIYQCCKLTEWVVPPLIQY